MSENNNNFENESQNANKEKQIEIKEEQIEIKEESPQQNKSEINNFIKDDLIENINKFITELELCFDYVSEDTLSELKKFCNNLKNNDNLQKFAKNAFDILDKNKENITFILTTKTKLKGSYFDFLNSIILFDDILNFNIFKDENKNTKKTIVNYLNNIYLSIIILEKGVNEAERNFEKVFSFLKEKQELEQEKMNKMLNETLMGFETSFKNNVNLDLITKNLEKTKDGFIDFENKMNNLSLNLNKNTNQNSNSNSNSDGNGDGFVNVFKSLMENKEIMNLASELSNDIQKENIDPMSLLTSMFTGKQDSNLQNLLNNVTNKLDEKIKSGKINKEEMENNAHLFFNSLNKTKNEPID